MTKKAAVLTLQTPLTTPTVAITELRETVASRFPENIVSFAIASVLGTGEISTAWFVMEKESLSPLLGAIEVVKDRLLDRYRS